MFLSQPRPWNELVLCLPARPECRLQAGLPCFHPEQIPKLCPWSDCIQAERRATARRHQREQFFSSLTSLICKTLFLFVFWDSAILAADHEDHRRFERLLYWVGSHLSNAFKCSFERVFHLVDFFVA